MSPEKLIFKYVLNNFHFLQEIIQENTIYKLRGVDGLQYGQ